ncbi:hypothetical protein N7457_004104 [Penicillium paradoxum]|uniref:uncharacterized protein n=1 Tax=Penicillium paradoxum TaxID=176176 RepID=UPI002549649A|nr:uncharacterized protein N7457_004104 [Penicillium paradoxum]KAJ5782330.1 hypothetical protein N7457_004104 [Penicillium paradoxum]
MRFILFSLSASVFYAIFYFSWINGLDALGHKCIESGKLPTVDAPLRTVYTGIEVVDNMLALLVTFFYPTLDGSNPGLLLHGIAFTGTFGATWTLIVLESWRKGNAGTIAAYPMVFGLIAQLLTFAFGIPLTCGLQLGSSITARRPNADNIRVPRAVLAILPLTFIIGFMGPTVAMSLPAPSVISLDMRQIAIAIWQPWPAYVSILSTAGFYLLSPFISENEWASRSSLRWVYAFAFANASLTHLVAWIVSLATVIAPNMFQGHFVESLHPAKVFALHLPWSGLTVDDVGVGLHVFLRWDYTIGTTGVLVWALSLYVVAHYQLLKTVSWPSLLLKVALLTVFTSPAAAAVELMWERDELVFAETGSKQVSKVKKSI